MHFHGLLLLFISTNVLFSILNKTFYQQKRLRLYFNPRYENYVGKIHRGANGAHAPRGSHAKKWSNRPGFWLFFLIKSRYFAPRGP